MKKEASLTDQLLSQKTAELRAVQKKLDGLKSRVDIETNRLLEEQAERLGADRKMIQWDIEQEKQGLDLLRKSMAELVTEVQELSKQVDAKKLELSGLERRITDAQTGLTTSEGELRSVETELKSLHSDKLALEQNVSRLEVSQRELEATIDKQKTTTELLKRRIQDLDDEYTQKIDDKKQSIVLLDAKLLDKATEIEEYNKAEASKRDELARWQQTLEEKDKNLRIRESKVAMGEQKLIQNSNLLNL